MKRLIAICAAVFFAGITKAETVPVKSGEHADFSRVVLQFGNLEEWEFGRVQGGYELRTSIPDAEFDLDQVYDFIPRDRIDQIYSPGPGRLFFSVACECTGDIFEIRKGRIVVDIKDGKPGIGAQFETFLEEDDQGQEPETSILPIQASPANQPVQFPRTVNWPGFGEPYEANATAASVLFSANDELIESNSRNSSSHLEEPPIELIPPTPKGEEVSPDPEVGSIAAIESLSTPSIHGPAGAVAPLDSVPLSKAMGIQTHELGFEGNAPEELPFLPVWPLEPLGQRFSRDGMPQPNQRETEVEARLLGQLSRAVSQGLISIPPPNVGNAVSGRPITSKTQSDLPQEIPVQPSATRPANLRMQTAADRDQPGSHENLTLTSQGDICIEAEVLDVANWGDSEPFLAPLDRLRTGIVGEFDRPNAEVILDLARRYIFLGFGAEAKLLLRSFQVDIPNSDILVQLAEVMDDGAARSEGRLQNQISCDTVASLWAVLAAEKIPAGAFINEKKVVLTFSGLPPHLRTHLGPWLTQRFLDRGDIDTAAKIRDLMERAPGLQQSGYKLARAQLASVDGRTSEQLTYLQEAVAENGPHSAEALAELIEMRLKLGQSVSERNALLASAMAVENRDSEIGRRLTRASIRAFAVGGQIEPTFARIFDARKNGYISENEAQDLLVETHLRNAQISSNASFLSIFYQYQDSLTGESENAKATRFLTAKRLIELGFPRRALEMYPEDGVNLSTADRRLLAQAYLDLGEPKAALHWVAGQADLESRKVEAQILRNTGNYAAAAEIYHELDMGAEFENSVWLAGDWQGVVDGSNPDRAAVVGLFIDSEHGEENMNLEDNEDKPESGGGERTINAGKELIARSSETRQALGALLFGGE